MAGDKRKLVFKFDQLTGAGEAGTTFTWNYENRNTVLLSPSGVPLTNIYDAVGLRRNDGTSNYIWDRQNLLQIRNVVGGSKTFQFTGAPNVYDGVVSQYEPSGSDSQFYAFDMTGSNRVATHATGGITATFDYTAFGTEYYVTGGTNMMNRFGGKWGYFRPSPSGLLYIQQRWLDVVLALWLNRDRIWPRGGWNPYQDVGNNPVTWADPTGLQAVDAARPVHVTVRQVRNLSPTDINELHRLGSYVGQMDYMDTTPDTARQEQHEINIAVAAIKRYIAQSVPPSAAEPSNLKALYLAINQLGSNWGYSPVSDPAKPYKLKGYETCPASENTRCNYFVASAYILGAAATKWPRNRSWLQWPLYNLPTANELAGPDNISNLPFSGIGMVPGYVVAFHSSSGSGHATLYVGGDLYIYAGGIGVAKLGDLKSIMEEHDYFAIRCYKP